MSMTIGRCSIARDPYPGSFSQQGNVVSFRSDNGATSLTQSTALNQQLLGLVENQDEDTFPFTWSLDSTYDGFYKIRSVQVDPESVYITSGVSRFTITMERVGGGYSRPQFESIAQQVVYSNSHGVTAPAGFDLSWYAGSGTEADVAYTGIWSLTLAEGAHKWHAAFAPSGPTSYYISTRPADYYLNTARVEVQYGSTWYPVVGQQVPLGTGVNWRISNGAIRLYPTSVSGNGRFTVEAWSSADGLWVGKEYGIITGASTFVNATGTTSDPSSLKIVKNSPEAVVVRLRQQAEAGAVFDFTLRKGDFNVECSIMQPTGATSQTWGIQLSSATASTSSTGAIRSTAATSSRYQQISCGLTVTADTVNGGLRLSSAAAAAVFAISPNADIFGLGYTAANTRDLFLAARSERAKVVTR
jgi:hypothetical protein